MRSRVARGTGRGRNARHENRDEIQTQLPREDSGKIFKRRLRDPYWERAGRRI